MEGVVEVGFDFWKKCFRENVKKVLKNSILNFNIQIMNV